MLKGKMEVKGQKTHFVKYIKQMYNNITAQEGPTLGVTWS
jgi:hypothetical protein